MDNNEDNKFWKTKDFAKLKDKWYDKLNASGFKDLEDSEESLQTWSFYVHNKAYSSTAKAHAKETYYRWAGYLLHDHSFDSEKEKLMWELHSSGLSLRKINKILREKKVKTCLVKIHETITKLAKVMKAKYGSPTKKRINRY